MIEIAISLAIIGFALAAIIGILPSAMRTQRDNQQETIINQDSSIWMDAFRNGERGLDDLTNYVMAITNYVTVFAPSGLPNLGASWVDGYTYTGCMIRNAAASPPLLLTNGYRIIGLLGTPKIIPQYTGNGRQNGFWSNHVIAFVRSMSGPASEKSPQQNDIVRDLGLKYRMIADVTGYGTNFFDPSWTNYVVNGVTNFDTLNHYKLVKNLEINLHEIRLTFKWPLRPNGDAGPNRQIYRTMVGGYVTNLTELGYPLNTPDYMLFFFQPRAYAKAP